VLFTTNGCCGKSATRALVEGRLPMSCVVLCCVVLCCVVLTMCCVDNVLCLTLCCVVLCVSMQKWVEMFTNCFNIKAPAVSRRAPSSREALAAKAQESLCILQLRKRSNTNNDSAAASSCVCVCVYACVCVFMHLCVCVCRVCMCVCVCMHGVFDVFFFAVLFFIFK